MTKQQALEWFERRHESIKLSDKCAEAENVAMLCIAESIVREPRLLTLEEVEALPYGHVLIETDKSGSLHWLDALLFCKNTNFSFDFITLEGRARLLGTEYNREWRCWTSRPTNEQGEAVKWDD